MTCAQCSSQGWRHSHTGYTVTDTRTSGQAWATTVRREADRHRCALWASLLGGGAPSEQPPPVGLPPGRVAVGFTAEEQTPVRNGAAVSGSPLGWGGPIVTLMPQCVRMNPRIRSAGLG